MESIFDDSSNYPTLLKNKLKLNAISDSSEDEAFRINEKEEENNSDEEEYDDIKIITKFNKSMPDDEENIKFQIIDKEENMTEDEEENDDVKIIEKDDEKSDGKNKADTSLTNFINDDFIERNIEGEKWEINKEYQFSNEEEYLKSIIKIEEQLNSIFICLRHDRINKLKKEFGFERRAKKFLKQLKIE